MVTAWHQRTSATARSTAARAVATCSLFSGCRRRAAARASSARACRRRWGAMASRAARYWAPSASMSWSSATGGLLSDAEDVGAVELGRAEREQLLVRRGRCVGEQLDGPVEVVDLVGVAGDLEVPLDHAAGGERLAAVGEPVTEPDPDG